MSWPLIVSAPILRIGCGVKAGRKPGCVNTSEFAVVDCVFGDCLVDSSVFFGVSPATGTSLSNSRKSAMMGSSKMVSCRAEGGSDPSVLSFVLASEWTRRQGFRHRRRSFLDVFELPQGATDGTFPQERGHRLILRFRKIQKTFNGWRQAKHHGLAATFPIARPC